MENSVPTIYDVAAKADVSAATVSRFVNGTAKLSDKTRRRVQKAIDALGYVPNATAQGLSLGRTRVIGLVFPKDFIMADHDPMSIERESFLSIERESVLFLDSVLRGIEREASDNDYSVLINFVHPSEEESDNTIRRMTGFVDGIIGLEMAMSESVISEIRGRIPVVVLAGEPASSEFHTVHVDNESAMVAIAEHLVTEHHIRDAAFMGGLKRSPDARDRRRAFLEAFEARGGKVAKYNDLEGDWAVASGVAAMKARMALKQPLPRAVVCANDQMAYGVMSVLKVAGYNVPGDVVVTGFDDTPMSLLADPPLTTVRQDTLGMGRAAVRLILESLEHPGGPSQSVALPTKPIIRNSCGCAFAYAETPEKRLAS